MFFILQIKCSLILLLRFVYCPVGFHIETISINITQSSSKLIVGSKEKINFTCAVEVLCSGPCGITILTFKWVKDGIDFSNESSRMVRLDELSSIYEETEVINREIIVADAGQYQCQAEISETSSANSSALRSVSVTSKYL